MKKWLLAGAFLSSGLLLAQKFTNELIIVQNGNENIISTENASIHLEKKAFVIRFENKFYNTKKEYLNALQVAVIENDADVGQIEEGMPINLIPYFEVGTGLAADEDGLYTTVNIDRYGHHYLFYENDDNKSVNLVSRKEPLGIFEWQINRFYSDEKDEPIERIKVNYLNFVFLTDFNANGIIDLDELRIGKIHFN